jgi:tetratricopeptide (TPR) repeat protein
VKSYEKALHSLSELDPKEVYKFHNYLIVIYNLLGLSYVNREEVDQGMGCLSKAAEIYENFKEIKTVDVYNNRSEEAKGRKFQCYYQGGFNHDQMEQSFTLTLFYLAQTYTKLGFKEKAAEHCGRTLQRQYATDKYEINDFCHNLIGLSEFYQGNHLYSQAQYLLLLGLKILPEGKKKKMRATVQKTLGNMLLHML